MISLRSTLHRCRSRSARATRSAAGRCSLTTDPWRSDPPPPPISTTASNKPIYVVGATILHELIHWADYRNGIAYPSEEGLRFEKTVYGKIIL
jgi:hypothetical protein